MSDQLTGELNLIKRWEIHFQRKEATCGDETTLAGEDTAAAATRKLCRYPRRACDPPHLPRLPPANKPQTSAGFQCLLEKQKASSGVYRSWRQQLIGGGREAGGREAGGRPAGRTGLHIAAAPLTVWCEVTNASVCITAIPPVLQPG